MTASPPPARSPSLVERHTDHTRQWIVGAATDLLEAQGTAQITNAAVAERAGVSERTVYRHFAAREALLAEVAAEAARRLDAPPLPATLADLQHYPGLLFARFEALRSLTEAALSPEVFGHIRDSVAAQRWAAVQRLLEAELPEVDADVRAAAAANIRYLLAATSWHYYRHHLRFSAEQTVHHVREAIRLLLLGLQAQGASAAKRAAPRKAAVR